MLTARCVKCLYIRHKSMSNSYFLFHPPILEFCIVLANQRRFSALDLFRAVARHIDNIMHRFFVLLQSQRQVYGTLISDAL